LQNGGWARREGFVRHISLRRVRLALRLRGGGARWRCESLALRGGVPRVLKMRVPGELFALTIRRR
jgi:hypothetical protein